MINKWQQKIPTAFINIDYPGEKGERLFPDVNSHVFRYLVRHNTGIINQSNKWNILLFKEAYYA